MLNKYNLLFKLNIKAHLLEADQVYLYLLEILMKVDFAKGYFVKVVFETCHTFSKKKKHTNQNDIEHLF